MKVIKARGLVVKEFEANESDKRLLLLSKEHGRIMVYARGAKKPKSKFLSSAQLFCYSDFVLADGPGFFSVTQTDVIRSFYNLRLCYDTLMAAHLFAEICDKSTFETLNLDGLLLLALKSLSVLEKMTYPPKQVSAVFLLRCLGFHGLRPVTDRCHLCGRPRASFEGQPYIAGDGLTCRSCCMLKKTIPASDSCLAALCFILDSSLSASFHFKVRDDVLERLYASALFLWGSHFDFELVSCRGGGNKALTQLPL